MPTSEDISILQDIALFDERLDGFLHRYAADAYPLR